MPGTRIAAPLAAAALLAAASPAAALFHLWDVSELYSNADGTVQYVELFTEFASQEFVGGHVLRAEHGAGAAEELTFADDLPLGPGTSGRHFLAATAGFEAAAGIAPDFVIPDGFLDPPTLTGVSLVGAGAFAFPAGSLPASGASALYPGPPGQPVIDAPTPTNFAGETGVVPEAGQALLLATGALVLAAGRPRRATGRGAA